MAKARIKIEIADLPQVKAALKAQAEAIERRDEALYQAWTIIANAYVNASPGPETGWDAAPAEWRQAAERWRDEQFHPLLGDGGERVAEAGDTGPLPPVPESAYPYGAVALGGPDSSLLAWGEHLVEVEQPEDGC